VNVFRIITARVSEREGEVMSRENRREGAATGMQRARRIDLLLLMLCRTLPRGETSWKREGREGNRQRRGRRRMEDPVPSRIASSGARPELAAAWTDKLLQHTRSPII
jgi:hypothetical protein